VEWTASGAEAAYKHLGRVWSLSDRIAQMDPAAPGEGDEDLLREMHKTIRDVTNGVESFGFNAAIAKLYAFTNTLARTKASHAAQRRAMMTLAQLMSPMTPHLAEDIWATQGGAGLIAEAPWPVADEAMLVEDTVTYRSRSTASAGPRSRSPRTRRRKRLKRPLWQTTLW
jgi:leucyl-tRNA synthetase